MKHRVNIHVRLHLACDQIRGRHDSRSGFIPLWDSDVVTFHQLRMHTFVGCDAIEHTLRKVSLIRYVLGDGDGWERRHDGNVGGFGVDKEDDVGANVFD